MLTLIVGTVYFLGPFNLLMYGINDIFDYESDIKNPRKGGVEGMKESRALHPAIMKAILWTNIPCVVLLLTMGSWAANLVLLSVIFAAIAYSLRGLRFKEIPFLDSLTSSYHFVGPLLYALALTGFPSQSWPWITAFFLWGMASHAFGAVQDIIPDRKGSITSIATVCGARRTVIFSVVLYAIATSIVALQGSLYLPIAAMGVCYILNSARFLSITDATSARTNQGWRHFLWLNYASGMCITFVIIAALSRLI
jgi:4-hydroxybenzoate polyprenyltransferase